MLPMDGGVKFNGKEKSSQIAEGIIHGLLFQQVSIYNKN